MSYKIAKNFFDNFLKIFKFCKNIPGNYSRFSRNFSKLRFTIFWQNRLKFFQKFAHIDTVQICPQVVRFIAGQSLQLQQVQTSSGPAYVAVPSISPTLQQTNSTQSATVVPSVATVPIQTSVFNQNVIKKTNQVNTSCISNQHLNSSSNNKKPKKRKEEETTKLDLANLIKISGKDSFHKLAKRTQEIPSGWGSEKKNLEKF